MKRVKLAILVALAAFALASCDYMLEVLFPEFSSDDQGNFGQKTIQITVRVGDGDGGGPGGYTLGGAPTGFDIKVIAVEWSFDFTGVPYLVTSGGDLDPAVHNFVVAAPQKIPAGSGVGQSADFVLQVPDGVWAVVAFEDVNGDGVPNDTESTAIAQWETLPANWPYTVEEFDLYHLESVDPPRTEIQALELHLAHQSYDPPACVGAVYCDRFEFLY